MKVIPLRFERKTHALEGFYVNHIHWLSYQDIARIYFRVNGSFFRCFT